jgi:hypothetical protein
VEARLETRGAELVAVVPIEGDWIDVIFYGDRVFVYDQIDSGIDLIFREGVAARVDTNEKTET